MPMWRRTAMSSARALLAGPSAVPQTCSAPVSKPSMPLMQRTSDDLPDPEGPQITTRSPAATASVTSRRA